MLPGNHTGYKNILHLHGLIVGASLECFVLLPDTHTGYNYTLHLHGILLVNLKTPLKCCLIFTLVTVILYPLMGRLLMGLKTPLCWCLITTLLTRISNTFMLTFGVMP